MPGMAIPGVPGQPFVLERADAISQSGRRSTGPLSEEDIRLLETEQAEYRLGPGDVIEVLAAGMPEIARQYIIGPDGQITLPVAGVARLERLTREEAATKIEQALSPHYRDPDVTILVQQYNNNRIYVLGEVRWPGEFNFAGRPMLLGALARAQGLTESADMRGCTIVRGKGTLIEVDLYELLRQGNRHLNLPLLPEDTVYVQAEDERMFYVLGEVSGPGVFPLGKQMDVVRALSLAGGPTEDGILDSVRIIRRVGGKAHLFKADLKAILAGAPAGMSIPIQSGDIVYVPRKGIAKFNYILRQITPSLDTLLIGGSVNDLLGN